VQYLNWQKGNEVEMDQKEQCYIKRMILGDKKRLSITAKNYNNLKIMREVLISGLAVERTYDLLIANYIELEEELASLSIQNSVLLPEGYDWFYTSEMKLNRRLINLLSVARSYLDHNSHNLKEASLAGAVDFKSVKAVKSKCYDQYFEYRFMEELRNHTQHYGLPLHFISFGSSIVGEDQNAKMFEYSVEYAATVDYLEKNIKFKKSVLKECPKKIDLKKTTRVYMECLGQIQEKMRSELSPILANARKCIDNVRESFRQILEPSDNNNLLGLEAIILSENGKSKDSFSLNTDWDDIRIKLEERNRDLKGIGSSYITSMTKPSKI
jgi:hypothetical protein